MSFVKEWTVVDDHTIRLNFKGPSPVQQITDLLQFVSVIDPAGMDTVETKPAGSGAYMLADRAPGQRIHLVANPHYWRAGEPVSRDVTITVFSDDQSATAALESGAVDMVYGGSARSGVRLKRDGYPLLQGPGPLVQALRLNPNRGPVPQRRVPPGLQLPGGSGGHATPRLCRSRRGRGIALGAGQPGPTMRPTTRAMPSTSTRRRCCWDRPVCRRPT